MLIRFKDLIKTKNPPWAFIYIYLMKSMLSTMHTFICLLDLRTSYASFFSFINTKLRINIVFWFALPLHLLRINLKK